MEYLLEHIWVNGFVFVFLMNVEFLWNIIHAILRVALLLCVVAQKGIIHITVI